MPDTIIIKYSDTAGNTPTLVAGEIAFNRADGKLFWKNSAGTLQSMILSGVGYKKIVTKTASYTPTAADINGTVFLMDVATTHNFTVPPYSSVPFPVGTKFYPVQYGAGQTVIVKGSGVTVISIGSKLTSIGQGAKLELENIGTDVWLLSPAAELGYDSDAQTYLTATSITNATDSNQVNKFVSDLKAYSLWSKFTALWILVWGNASMTAVNLKNPGTNNLGFQGTVAQSSGGISQSGTAGYATTGILPSSLNANSCHLSFYSRTPNTSDGRDIGGEQLRMWLYMSGNFRSQIASGTATNFTAVTTSGFFLGSRTASNVQVTYKNGSQINSASTTSDLTGNASEQLYLLANSFSGGPVGNSNRQCALASVGAGMDATDAANFYTAVNTFMTARGINV